MIPPDNFDGHREFYLREPLQQTYSTIMSKYHHILFLVSHSRKLERGTGFPKLLEVR
jgi:hypothetical protein